MGRVERPGDLRRGSRALRSGVERALALEHRLEVAALDVAHGQVELSVVLARLVDGNDVRVVERRGEPRLLQEAARGSARPRPVPARSA